MRIDLQRYREDPACAEPDGLKRKLLADLESRLGGIHLQRNRVLVATYIRPNISRGGIIFTAKTGEEDRYQGKAGLLLKCGPLAFDFDEVRERLADGMSEEQARDELGIPYPGDWVLFRTSETWETGIEIADGHGVCASCRFIYDDAIIARLNDPSIID
jgi:hypothetical protein